MWMEANKNLLDVLVRDVNEEEDQPQHMQLRHNVILLRQAEFARPVDINLDRLRSGATPGMDNIDAELVKRGWPYLP